MYRPELFLGKFVYSNEQLREVRLGTIRSHTQVAWDRATSYRSALLDLHVSQLRQADGLWNKWLPDMVLGYFDDMSTVLKQLYRVVRRGGIV